MVELVSGAVFLFFDEEVICANRDFPQFWISDLIRLRLPTLFGLVVDLLFGRSSFIDSRIVVILVILLPSGSMFDNLSSWVQENIVHKHDGHYKHQDKCAIDLDQKLSPFRIIGLLHQLIFRFLYWRLIDFTVCVDINDLFVLIIHLF